MELFKGSLIATNKELVNKHGVVPKGEVGVYSHVTTILPLHIGYLCKFNKVGDFILDRDDFTVMAPPVRYEKGDEVFILDSIDIVKGKKCIVNSRKDSMVYVDLGFTEVAVPYCMLLPCNLSNHIKKYILETGEFYDRKNSF